MPTEFKVVRISILEYVILKKQKMRKEFQLPSMSKVIWQDKDVIFVSTLFIWKKNQLLFQGLMTQCLLTQLSLSAYFFMCVWHWSFVDINIY